MDTCKGSTEDTASLLAYRPQDEAEQSNEEEGFSKEDKWQENETKPSVSREEPLVQDDMVNSTHRRGRQSKRGAKDKQCLVCGDRALGYNFNAITCESCKAFFRRNAFRNIWGRCNGECEISLESRSYCKKCRLKKCFAIGMKRDLILNERQKEERRLKIHENRVQRFIGTSIGEGGGDVSPHMSDESNSLPTPEPERKASASVPAGPPLDMIAGCSHMLPGLSGIQMPPGMMEQLHASGLDITKMASGSGGPSGVDISKIAGAMSAEAMAKMSAMMKSGGLAQLMGGFSGMAGLSQSEGMSPHSHVLAGEVEAMRYQNMAEPSQKKLVEMIEAFQKSFDAPITRQVVRAPNNSDFLNMADASVRRLIKMVKHLSCFRKLAAEDQVILLKGSVLEVLVLRSVKLFDPKSMNWNLPGNRGITAERLERGSSESLNFMQQYQSFACGVMTAIRRDNVILMMLMLLTIFSPDRQGLKNKKLVEEIQEDYAQVLQEFIQHNHSRDKVMFARVLQKLADIRDLQEGHQMMLQNAKLHDLEPLMMEIFDLSS